MSQPEVEDKGAKVDPRDLVADGGWSGWSRP